MLTRRTTFCSAVAGSHDQRPSTMFTHTALIAGHMTACARVTQFVRLSSSFSQSAVHKWARISASPGRNGELGTQEASPSPDMSGQSQVPAAASQGRDSPARSRRCISAEISTVSSPILKVACVSLLWGYVVRALGLLLSLSRPPGS